MSPAFLYVIINQAMICDTLGTKFAKMGRDQTYANISYVYMDSIKVVVFAMHRARVVVDYHY